MKTSKASRSNAKIQHQSSSSAPMKRKTQKLTHFFFVLRNAKQFHQFSSHLITASVKIHPNFNPISSNPIMCHRSQTDFQFAFCVDLTNSNTIENPELFSPKITISISDPDNKESVGTAIIPPIKSKSQFSSGNPIVYLINHQDTPVKLISSPKIGGFINVTCAFGLIDQKQTIEPSLNFIELTAQQLQKSDQEPDPEVWEADAIEKGWVPPEKAAEIWQRIAREHGWKSPEDRNMVLQFDTIEDSKPSEPDNTDLISFSSDNDNDENLSNNIQNLNLNQNDDAISGNADENNKFNENVEDFVNFALASKYTIHTNNVFDQNPKIHQLSQQFTIFEMQPEWQPTDSDTDLNQDLTNLLTGSTNTNLYEIQKSNMNSPKGDKKK